ncbi:MAG: hypothetical protein WBA01_17060, partial [Phormidesmis sp.]
MVDLITVSSADSSLELADSSVESLGGKSLGAESLGSGQVIGTVKGPGENGNQYVFITSDNRQVKIGEFVYYEVDSPETGQASGQPSSSGPLQILGKISDRRLSDHLPDRMFADAQISPETIAAIVGFSHANPEIYEVTVDVIGYFEPALG